ncbi:MAG TPA: acyl-CoA dehydrogenase [Aliidongia sp.]|nr:acyl-CoA dehydrogenase [Aliidongia sp.]
MTLYTPPLADMRFTLEEVAGLDEIAALPGCEAASSETVFAVLDEAAKLARDVLAPLNQIGDRHGAVLENGVVTTPPGFKEAYRTYVEGGWNSLPFEEEWGGQALPAVVALAVSEMWNSANMGFALCPLLNFGAVEALQAHGSPELQRTYLPKLVSGEWTGTMNLTEPQAGSDVGALRTRAVHDGTDWRITGQKIFITYGDHDFAENIIHLVLARTPDGPPGTRGISLFLVPKFLVGEDGSLGRRNDLRTVSLEHKLGIHASPTAVLSYGDDEGAVGYLIGRENAGMECMFTMMNSARLNVGLQGIAISERAYQQARDYAMNRVQGKPLGARGDGPFPIIHHPDVRRMLLTIKTRTSAARGLAYFAAASIDKARHLPDPEARAAAQAQADLLIPLVKAWSTDLGVENTSLAVQIHGGMGFIEETGVAQHYRDARIAPIYEGTNGIQALDLLGRKVARDRGAAAGRFIGLMRELSSKLGAQPGDDLATIRMALDHALNAVERATGEMVTAFAEDSARAAAGAVPYLNLFAVTAGGWVLATEALAAQRRLTERDGDPGFNEAKLVGARFYAEQFLMAAAASLPAITGGATILAMPPERL